MIGPTWTFLLAARDAPADLSSGVLGELPGRSRKATFRLTGIHDTELTISGEDAIAGDVILGGTDIIARRDADLMFRGRVTGVEDTIDADHHDLKLNASSYLWLLGHRDTVPGHTLTYSAVDQAAIAWDLITDSQARTGGLLGPGVTRGLHPAGTPRDRTYELDKNIGEALAELAAVDNGFDQDIGPTLAYDIWHPQRGTLRDFPVVVVRDRNSGAANALSVGRTASLDSYFNSARMGGAEGVTVADATVADIATRPEGIFDHFEGRTDVTVAATLVEANTAALATGAALLLSYSIALVPSIPELPSNLAPAEWSPGELWVGDTTRLYLHSGYLEVDTTALRISELAVDISDDDVESVGLTFGAPPPADFLYRVLSAMAAKLTNLSRR